MQKTGQYKKKSIGKTGQYKKKSIGKTGTVLKSVLYAKKYSGMGGGWGQGAGGRQIH